MSFPLTESSSFHSENRYDGAMCSSVSGINQTLTQFVFFLIKSMALPSLLLNLNEVKTENGSRRSALRNVTLQNVALWERSELFLLQRWFKYQHGSVQHFSGVDFMSGLTEQSQQSRPLHLHHDSIIVIISWENFHLNISYKT